MSKDTFFSKKRTLNFGGTLFDLSSPIVMGILNLTPDSFFDGGNYSSDTKILQRCEQILSEGVSIIDIGAYSSRPGAAHITEEEELNRLVPALSSIRKEFPNAILSIDTFRAEVSRIVVQQFGCQMINDISGGEIEETMLETIALLKVPYVLMHIQGTPQSMQQHTDYTDLVLDIVRYFSKKLDLIRKLGIQDVILDPGFGFGKTLEQNYQLLAKLEEFKIFGLPILAGLSRKSMIYKQLETTPEDALAGTISANTLALLKGADILRVHDVKEAADAIKIVTAYKSSYL